jgi:hypothetical protein
MAAHEIRAKALHLKSDCGRIATSRKAKHSIDLVRNLAAVFGKRDEAQIDIVAFVLGRSVSLLLEGMTDVQTILLPCLLKEVRRGEVVLSHPKENLRCSIDRER